MLLAFINLSGPTRKLQEFRTLTNDIVISTAEHTTETLWPSYGRRPRAGFSLGLVVFVPAIGGL